MPACANHKLLTEILRDTWKFTGYVISDQSALERIISEHHYVKDFVTAAADVVNAGVSLEISRNLVNNVMMNVGQYYKPISESHFDMKSSFVVLSVRMY